jgi:hypothetical protein
MQNISIAEYSSFQAAYTAFNELLFDKQLPDALITLQRKSKAYGYFSPKRFTSRLTKDTTVDEIAMNPEGFMGRTDRDIIGTLVHEMVHLWQEHYGKPPKKAYHNKEWAAKMHEVGLHPSSTGKEGGKETGRNCSHYILEDGPFAEGYSVLESMGFKLNWDSSLILKDKPKPSKVKFTCGGCNQNVWGKPGILVMCGICEEDENGNRIILVSEEGEE